MAGSTPPGYPSSDTAAPAAFAAPVQVVAIGPGPIPLSGRELRKSEKLQQNESWRASARDFRGNVMKAFGTENKMKFESVKIVGREEHSGVSYFRLRMKGVGDGAGEWEMLQRYSGFDKLRNELGVTDHRVGSIFPGKTFMSKCEGTEADKRQQILQTWIDGLLREFHSGGDGRHAIMPINLHGKLEKLHSFFGISLVTGQLMPTAALVGQSLPDAAAAALPIAQAVPYAQPSAPPLPEALAVPLPSAGVVADDDAQFQAAIAASVATQAADEEARIAADLAAIETLREAEEQERLRREEAEKILAQEEEDEELNRRAQEEEGRRRLEEEIAAQHILQVQEERQRAEEEEQARLKAEEEEARRVTDKAEEEEQARLEAEKEEAQRKAEEEEARRVAEAVEADRKAEEEVRRKAEEEARLIAERQARLKAEEEAGKTWLQRAMDQANYGKQLDDQGQQQQALDQYKKCVSLFAIVHKKETSEKIRGAIVQKMQELTLRSDALSAEIMAAEAAHAADLLSGGGGGGGGGQPEVASEAQIDAEAAAAAALLSIPAQAVASLPSADISPAPALRTAVPVPEG